MRNTVFLLSRLCCIFLVCLFLCMGDRFCFHTDIIPVSVWCSEVFVVFGTIDIQYISNKFAGKVGTDAFFAFRLPVNY